MKPTAQELKEIILDKKLVVILRGLAPEQIEPTVAALYEGGVRLLEITFDPKSPDCIEQTGAAIKAALAMQLEDFYVGAGTVMTVEQAQAAYDAGATFMLSPNLNVTVLKKAKELGMLTMPGCLTPSEIAAAHEARADIVKVFPASRVGATYFKELQGPMGHIPLSAVGGVDEHNLEAYLAAGAKSIGVGSNIVNLKDIENGDFNAVTEKAKKYTEQL